MTNAISRRRGDTYPDKFIIMNGDEAQDITDWTFKMTVNVKQKPTASDAALYTLTGVITDAAEGAVEFRPTTTNADQLPGKYYYDVQAIDDEGYIRTPFVSTYTYLQDLTKATS